MKTFFKILTVFVLGLTLASCSKDDEDDVTENTSTSSLLLANWETTSMVVWRENAAGSKTTNQISVSISQTDSTYTQLHFYKNGTFVDETGDGGNYTLTGNSLTMYDEENSLTWTIVECNQTTLKLQIARQYNEDSGDYLVGYYVFTKK